MINSYNQDNPSKQVFFFFFYSFCFGNPSVLRSQRSQEPKVHWLLWRGIGKWPICQCDHPTGGAVVVVGVWWLKSGINSPVEGKVVYPSIYQGFRTIQTVVGNGISEASTVVVGCSKLLGSLVVWNSWFCWLVVWWFSSLVWKTNRDLIENQPKRMMQLLSVCLWIVTWPQKERIVFQPSFVKDKLLYSFGGSTSK